MIYIIMLIFITILYFILNKTALIKYNKNNLVFCILVFLFFTIIQGFRGYSVGIDTQNYVEIYERIRNVSWLSVIIRDSINVEIGFGLIMKIMSTLQIDVRLFLILIAIIINGGLTYFVYKNSKNPLLSFIIFMGAEFFTLSFTAIRQMIAVVIVLNTYSFIKEKNYKVAIPLMVLATTFHMTSLVFIPVFFYDKIKINKKMIIIAGIVFIFLQTIGFILLEVFVKETQYAVYLKNTITGDGLKQLFVIIIYTIIGVLVAWKNEKNIEKYKLLLLIMCTAIFIQSLTWRIPLIGRVTWYFYVFNMIYLPNIISEVKNIKYRYGLNTLIGALSITQFIFFSINMYDIKDYIFIN